MSILNPAQDAAALKPLIDAAVAEAIEGLADKVAPAIGVALKEALDGLTITTTISKKS
jgi:hypothetical protein